MFMYLFIYLWPQLNNLGAYVTFMLKVRGGGTSVLGQVALGTGKGGDVSPCFSDAIWEENNTDCVLTPLFHLLHTGQ